MRRRRPEGAASGCWPRSACLDRALGRTGTGLQPGNRERRVARCCPASSSAIERGYTPRSRSRRDGARTRRECMAVAASGSGNGDTGERARPARGWSSGSPPQTRRRECRAGRASSRHAPCAPSSAVDVRELGGRIEMAQRSAERAAVARLAVADVASAALQYRAAPRPLRPRPLQVALARHQLRLRSASSVTRR